MLVFRGGFGLIQALGRLVRCKGLAAVALLWRGRFGWFLVRGVGSFVALRGVSVQLRSACASEFAVQHLCVVTDPGW